jgi:hypothetical protein
VSRPTPSRSARGANPRRTLGDGHQVGLSVLDWRSHAIDERRCHPVGVFKAECGHLLMVVTTLHEAPNGKPCEACAAQQFVRAVKDNPDQIRADSDVRTDCRCPLQSLVPAAVSPDAATGVTLRIVAALPTPALRTGAFLAVLTHGDGAAHVSTVTPDLSTYAHC